MEWTECCVAVRQQHVQEGGTALIFSLLPTCQSWRREIEQSKDGRGANKGDELGIDVHTFVLVESVPCVVNQHQPARRPARPAQEVQNFSKSFKFWQILDL